MPIEIWSINMDNQEYELVNVYSYNILNAVSAKCIQSGNETKLKVEFDHNQTLLSPGKYILTM